MVFFRYIKAALESFWGFTFKFVIKSVANLG